MFGLFVNKKEIGELRRSLAPGMLKLMAQSGMGKGRGPFKKAVEKLKLVGNVRKKGKKNDTSPLGKR